jgi:RNA polymerase sigma factor (sigma-70 family)
MMAPMDRHGLQNVLRTLTARCGRPVVAALSDGDLLRRFNQSRDEEAFAELHRRHGPLVWAACRTLLRMPADAEDAYQATFLTLVQSASKIRNPAAVGAWLHGVAVKAGLKLRQRTVRRRSREERATRSEVDRPVADVAWERLLAALHEEVERLPAGLRAAFVLCDLQGVSQPDAARRLGWPLGSLSGRLSRARARLAGRIQARGVTPSVAAGVLGVAATTTEAGVVPVALTLAVRRFAVAPGAASAAVQALVSEVTTMTQLKWAVAAVLAAGVATLGAGTVLMPSVGGQPPAGPDSGRPAAGAADVALHAEFAGMGLSRYTYTPSSHYRYLPLAAGQAAEPLSATVMRLEFQAAAGWEFCGAVDMQLTAAEVAALRDVRAAARETAEAKRETHRVLVFKRSASPVPLGPAAAASAAPPTSAGGGPLPPSTPPAGGGFVAPTPGVPTDPATAPSPRGGLDLFGADDTRARTAAASEQSTVIYRAKVAAAETLEKVAVDLAKNRRRGAVTAIADQRTGSLILTGEAVAIKEIVERLEKLEAELDGPKHQLAPSAKPSLGINY